MADFGVPSAETEVNDLSAGSLPESEKAGLAGRLELDKQRLWQRSGLFWAVLLFAVIMTGSFLWFVSQVLCLISINGGKLPDWHLILLGSGLILPPTIMLYGLMRRVYEVERVQMNGASSQDSASPSAEIVSAFSSMATALSDVIKSRT
ncbi:MAG: hypothetical protein RBT67_07410 [Thauera sp.]|nr:hypothetical protein [Thauera sp.]